jgi:hypothetical protein
MITVSPGEKGEKQRETERERERERKREREKQAIAPCHRSVPFKDVKLWSISSEIVKSPHGFRL